VLGIDDGPFDKWRQSDVPIVGVVMEGADLVEGVALTRFAIDGPDVAAFLAGWIASLRFRPSLRAVVLGGITIAGLAIVDLDDLARRTGLPALSVTRKQPSNAELERALHTAGLDDRIELLARTPTAARVNDHLWVTCAGATPDDATRLLTACRRKGALPEPLRLAHLIATAVEVGESRGRA
jgi:endonuclease V-like protein UPF0215 family